MIIIRVKKRLFLVLVAVPLVCSLGLNVYHYTKNTGLERNYEALICMASQFESTRLIPFMAEASSASDVREIEIFDIVKGQVIKRIEPSSKVQKKAESYLGGITGMYVKAKPFPEKGYIIKIPMNPSMKANTHWLKDYGINSVNKVFIIFPAGEKPYLLVLDKQGRPLFYDFEGSTDELMNQLDFHPEAV